DLGQRVPRSEGAAPRRRSRRPSARARHRSLPVRSLTRRSLDSSAANQDDPGQTSDLSTVALLTRALGQAQGGSVTLDGRMSLRPPLSGDPMRRLVDRPILAAGMAAVLIMPAAAATAAAAQRQESGTAPVTVSLHDQLNNDGIGDGPGKADFDGSQYSYP